jgi:hypothetical protein
MYDNDYIDRGITLIAKTILSLGSMVHGRNPTKIPTIWTETFGKISVNWKVLNCWAIFSIFEAEAPLKVLKIHSTKVVPNKCPQLFRLQT